MYSIAPVACTIVPVFVSLKKSTKDADGLCRYFMNTTVSINTNSTQSIRNRRNLTYDRFDV